MSRRRILAAITSYSKIGYVLDALHCIRTLNPIAINRRFWARIEGEETELLCSIIENLGMVFVSGVDLGIGGWLKVRPKNVQL